MRGEEKQEERSGEICQRRREKNEGKRYPEEGNEIDKVGEEEEKRRDSR